MLIGYARVSTDDQSLDLQLDALNEAGCKPPHDVVNMMLPQNARLARTYEVDGKIIQPDQKGAMPGTIGVHSFDAGVYIQITNYVEYGGGLVPTPPQGTNWEFSIATFPIKSYAFGQGAGITLPLQSKDVNPVGFMNVIRGTESIQASFKPVAPPPPDTVNVRAPVAGDPDVIVDQVAVVEMGGAPYIRAGRQSEVGIEIGYTASSTDGSNGILGAVQLVNSTRTLTKNNGSKITSTTNGIAALDIALNQATIIYLDRVSTVKNGLLQISDSPAQQVSSDFRKFEVFEQFQNYLMFKSSQADSSAWVPLKKLGWGWTAVATRNASNNQWTIDNSKSSITNYGVEQLTFEEPQWTSNIKQYSYKPS